MSKFLDPAFVAALLDNPNTISKVHSQKINECDERKRLADNQYVLAQLLGEALKLPEDDPERLAVVDFLKALGTIEKAK